MDLAAADASPRTAVGREPYEGEYLFRMLTFSDEDVLKIDRQRFAACAYPDSASAGRTVFIISHENTVYKRDWKGPSDTPSVYPVDPEKEGWSKLQ